MKAWLEFNDVAPLQGQPWIPLRENIEAESKPDVPQITKIIEYSGRATAAVSLDLKSVAEQLDWNDLSLDNHRPSFDGGFYRASDVLEGRNRPALGTYLVLDQWLEDQHKHIWDLHPDVVIALRLTRDGDTWFRSEEGWAEVARLKRNDDGEPVLLEMRAEFLGDYLLARGMGLYISSYLERSAAVTALPKISWLPDGYTKQQGRDSLEGVLYEDDFAPDGEKQKVRGALWRTEWFLPRGLSTRVRRDTDPSASTFAIDNAGGRSTGPQLTGQMTYLHFKPELANALSRYRGHRLGWYTLETGAIGAASAVHFGVNTLGAITAFGKDVGELPAWEQRIWSAYSIPPEGGVSKELFDAQMQCVPASTLAPESQLVRVLEELSLAGEALLGKPLLRDHPSVPDLTARVNRFRAADAQGLLGLAKDIVRLVVERIDVDALCSKLTMAKNEKAPGSLKALERVLALHIGEEAARTMTGALFGLYDLRLADAHLGGGGKVDSGLDRAGVDRSKPSIIQARQMLERLVATIEEITRTLSAAAE